MIDPSDWSDGAAEIDYIDLLDIPEGQSGAFKIEHTTVEAGRSHMISPMRGIAIGRQPAGHVVYAVPTTWMKLIEEDVGVWMTNEVCEQEQHWRTLGGMSGWVLVGGLGLGMAVRILRENPEVKKIVVVEKETDVIDLVWPYVKGENCEIMAADISIAIRSLTDQEFDFAFIDTWQSDSETTLFEEVIPIRELIHEHNVARVVHCWNEDVMRGQLHFSLIGRWASLSLPPSWEGAESVESRKAALRGGIDDDSIWTRWSVPFFQTIERAGIWDDFDTQNALLTETYAAIYGMPGWEETWRIVAPVLIERMR